MLKEKIAQMLIVGFKGTTLTAADAISKAILQRKIGGVILFAYNIENPKQLATLTQTLNDYAKETGMPLLISLDYEGGHVKRLKESAGFPKTFPAADVGKLPLSEAEKIAKQMAQTLKQAGVNVNFAPVVDVNVNADNPVIGKLGRSFSEDPERVIAYADIFSKAYQKNGIVSVFKHFPGHGSSLHDTHLEFVDITHTWQEYELTPYKKLLNTKDNCMVMAAHVVHFGLDPDGYPATLSKNIIQKLLRETLGFKGVVITDDMQMRAITAKYNLAEALRLAINAGVDLFIFGNQLASPEDPNEIVDIIYADVKAGHISEEQINASYQRIMHLKTHLTSVNP